MFPAADPVAEAAWELPQSLFDEGVGCFEVCRDVLDECPGQSLKNGEQFRVDGSGVRHETSAKGKFEERRRA